MANAFPNPFEANIQNVDGGIVVGHHNTILSFDDYEDGIRIGRFAFRNEATGVIYNSPNLLAPAPPIVGVVLQSYSAILGEQTYTDNSEAGRASQVDVLSKGLVTVDTFGADPTPYTQVYCHYLDDINFGLAQAEQALPSAVPAPFRFIRKVKPNVWLIQSFDYDI